MDKQAILKTAQNFVQSSDWVTAIGNATQAEQADSSCKVELFDNGRWRILHENQIGNLYVSSGVIVPLPAADLERVESDEDDEYNEAVQFAADNEKDTFLGWVEEKLNPEL